MIGFLAFVWRAALSRPGADQERLIRESITDAVEVMPKMLDGDLPGAMKQLHTEKSDGL